MLVRVGRRGESALRRGTDAPHEAVHATVVHLRRIVGAVSVALTQVTREAQDLVWDYQDVASDLRRSGGEEPDEAPSGPPVLRVVDSEE